MYSLVIQSASVCFWNSNLPKGIPISKVKFFGYLRLFLTSFWCFFFFTSLFYPFQYAGQIGTFATFGSSDYDEISSRGPTLQ